MSRYIELHPVNPQVRLIDKIVTVIRDGGLVAYPTDSLWKVEDLPALNEEYQIQKYLSEKFLGIGTDGGGICYGFCLDKNYSIFKCPLGDLDINEVVIVAKSTKDFFKKAMIENL